MAGQAFRYPTLEPDETPELIGARPVRDPFRGLEDPASILTQEWLAAQGELCRQAAATWPVRLFRSRLERLTRFDLLSAPRWAGQSAFFDCRPAGAEHSTVVVETAGIRRTLVDPHLIDPTGRTVLGRWEPSPNGRLLAYQLATDGTERFDLYLLDVVTGHRVGDPIPGCRYSALAWLPDSTAYYVARTHDGQAGIYFHTVDELQPTQLVFGSGYPDTAEFEALVAADGSRLVVLACTGVAATNEVWHASLDDPAAVKLVRLAALQDSWNTVWPADEATLYVLTDQDAPRGRLVRIGLADADAGELVTLVDETAAVLEGFAILDTGLDQPQLLTLTATDGRSALHRHDLRDGQLVGEVPLPGPGIVSELTFRRNGNEAWLVYSDPVTAETVYRYQAATGQLRPWQDAISPSTPALQVSSHTGYSADGVAVQVTLLRPAGEQGPLPTILQGYGAFGESQSIDYYAAALAWVEHGNAFAFAAVRGGGEHGEDWHLAGTRENKQHSIDDFITAGRYLIDAGLTPAAGLGAFGQSAGGLLVGAAMVQQPGLFAAVAAVSGLFDMARYELFGMGSHWSEEFGSRTEPAELDWLLGYSPYHLVRAAECYPAVLLTAFGQDTRVDPMHSRKLCAALQAATDQAPSSKPILLNQSAVGGHGEQDTTHRLDYFATVLGFFARQLT